MIFWKGAPFEILKAPSLTNGGLAASRGPAPVTGKIFLRVRLTESSDYRDASRILAQMEIGPRSRRCPRPVRCLPFWGGKTGWKPRKRMIFERRRAGSASSSDQ